MHSCDYLHAFTNTPIGDGASDAAGGAGNYGDFAFKTLSLCFLPIPG
jgi:hypothetical protein